MLTTGDPDFIRFDADSGIRYAMKLGTKEIGKDITVTILSPESTIVCNSQTTATLTTISNTPNYRTTWYIKVESASRQTAPFNYEVSVKAASAVATESAPVEGPLSLQADGIRQRWIFQDQEKVEFRFETEEFSRYNLNFGADVESEFEYYAAGATTPSVTRELVANARQSIGVISSQAGTYSLFVMFPKGRRVKFDATLKWE